MSQRSTRTLADGTRESGSLSAWVVGVAVGMFVLLQAVLPALHGLHHAAHIGEHRDGTASQALATADVCMHGSDGGLSDGDTHDRKGTQGGHPESNDCDECKTLLLAKSIGGVLVSGLDLSQGDLVACLGSREPDRVTVARHEHGLAARGPPALRV